MALHKLTDAKVRNFKGTGKIGDGGGLWLISQESGAKQWFARISIQGKRREIGLGGYPVVTLEMARRFALEARRVAKEGGDPIAARRQSQNVPTFRDACYKVLEIRRAGWSNPKHAQQFINTLETYAFPALGDLLVSNIESHHVLSALSPIWLEKAETAGRVKQRIEVVMKWSMARGYRTQNPVEAATEGLPKQSKKVTHRKALPYTDAAQCVSDIQASNAHPRTKLAIEMMILCASRPKEVRTARWDQIDEEKKVWTIQADEMKTGQTHQVPLSDRAFQILIEARGLSDRSELIFAGSKHGKPISENTFVKLIRSLGYEVDAHGFRTTFRTWVAEQTTFDADSAERALSHSIGNSARQAYDRSDLLEKRRPMMQAWASYLSEQPAGVVSIFDATA